MTEELISKLRELATPDRTAAVARAAVILVVGVLAARLSGRALARFIARRGNGLPLQLTRRLSAWGVFLLFFAWSLQELGFQLGVLLGAAGVMTVAIGFAAQTSLSNLVSGIFLFGEQPFRVGDLIEVEGVTGEVLAVDLFSTKLRTFTNHYVRIPNESMFKTKLVNLTRFPLRRLDLAIPVSLDQDLEQVRQVAFRVAEQSAYCLAEPAPLFFVTEFSPSSLVVQLSLWCPTPEYIRLLSSISGELTAAFREAGLALPYPHRVLHSASETPSLPRASPAAA